MVPALDAKNMEFYLMKPLETSFKTINFNCCNNVKYNLLKTDISEQNQNIRYFNYCGIVDKKRNNRVF